MQQDRLEERRDGRLGHRAQPQAGEGDAELAAGEVQVELPLDLQAQAAARRLCSASASRRDGPGADRRELRGHEIPVEHHKPQRRQHLPDDTHDLILYPNLEVGDRWGGVVKRENLERRRNVGCERGTKRET